MLSNNSDDNESLYFKIHYADTWAHTSPNDDAFKRVASGGSNESTSQSSHSLTISITITKSKTALCLSHFKILVS